MYVVCAYLYKIVDESQSAIIRSLPEYEGDIGWDAFAASCRVGSNFQADKLQSSLGT